MVNAAALTLIVRLQLRLVVSERVFLLVVLVVRVEKFRRLRMGMVTLIVLWAMVP